MSRPTNFTELIFVVEYKLWAAILNCMQTYVIATFVGTNVFVSSLHSFILSIPYKLIPFWLSLIFQMTDSNAKLKSHEIQEVPKKINWSFPLLGETEGKNHVRYIHI
jgi:hypothetical protein